VSTESNLPPVTDVDAETATAAFANSQPAGTSVQANNGLAEIPAPASFDPPADNGFLDGGEVSDASERPQEDPHPERARGETKLEVFGELPGNEFTTVDPVVFLSSTDEADLIDRRNRGPNLEETEESQAREQILGAALESLPAKNQLIETLRREGSDWTQFVQAESAKLGISVPKAEAVQDGAIISGERAVLRVRQQLGIGTLIQVPLWHSGIWLTFKAPEDSAMLELFRRIRAEKTSLGYQTYGLTFANTSVFYNQWLIDFALEHVYDSTLKNPETLRKNISSLDIPSLLWGLACAHYPRGFQYGRAVVNELGELVKEVRGRLNVGRCLWVDYKALTPWQINSHMARRVSATVTQEMLDRYRAEFTRGVEREVDLGQGVKMTLGVPSVEDYQNSGQKWVNGILHLFNSVVADGVDQDARQKAMHMQGKATNMRQYAHWVKKITLTKTNNDIVDVETIENTLSNLSSQDEIRSAYFRECMKYIDDSTIAVIATPTAHPAEDKRALPRFEHLLPLDVASTFFTLLVQKDLRIGARSST